MISQLIFIVDDAVDRSESTKLARADSQVSRASDILSSFTEDSFAAMVISPSNSLSSSLRIPSLPPGGFEDDDDEEYDDVSKPPARFSKPPSSPGNLSGKIRKRSSGYERANKPSDERREERVSSLRAASVAEPTSERAE